MCMLGSDGWGYTLLLVLHFLERGVRVGNVMRDGECKSGFKESGGERDGDGKSFSYL